MQDHFIQFIAMNEEEGFDMKRKHWTTLKI